MIRKAIKEDSYSIAKLIVESWQTAYRGLIDDNYLNTLSIPDRVIGWEKNILSQNKNNHIYVYEEDNKILGVIRFGKPDDESSNYNSEIHVLYVEPSLKRFGIGTKLFNFAKTYFVKQNTTNMIIWCLKNNLPSIKFYEKMGGSIVSSRKAFIHNIELEEVGLSYNLKSDNIYLREYINSDAEEISKIVVQNMLEVNSKDYGIEFCKNSAKDFTVDKILENFNKRSKVFVALKNNTVIGTAGIDKSWYNDDGEYWILTVFVDIFHHGQGIGKMLIQKIEEFAKEMKFKKLVIPASITACEFYHKLGYEYANGKKELNKDRMYIMEKYL